MLSRIVIMDIYEQIEGARSQLSKEENKEVSFYDHEAWIERNKAEISKNFPDVKIMGIGTESLVIENPTSKDQIWSLAYDRRKKYGILPYAENHNVHKILQILYPNDFAKIYSISGVGKKDAVKERILGDQLTDSEAILTFDRSNLIEEELHQAGFEITIDTAASNYLKENERFVYIDFVDGYSGGVKNINIDKIIEIFEKVTKELNTDQKARLKKQLLTSFVRLQELGVANSLFQRMVENNNFVIQDEIINKELAGKGNDRSVPRIRILLEKASDAVVKRGYRYDKRWLDI